MTPIQEFALHRAKVTGMVLAGIGITLTASFTARNPALSAIVTPLGLWATATLALDRKVVAQDERLARAAGIKLKRMFKEPGQN